MGLQSNYPGREPEEDEGLSALPRNYVGTVNIRILDCGKNIGVYVATHRDANWGIGSSAKGANLGSSPSTERLEEIIVKLDSHK